MRSCAENKPPNVTGFSPGAFLSFFLITGRVSCVHVVGYVVLNTYTLTHLPLNLNEFDVENCLTYSYTAWRMSSMFFYFQCRWSCWCDVHVWHYRIYLRTWGSVAGKMSSCRWACLKNVSCPISPSSRNPPRTQLAAHSRSIRTGTLVEPIERLVWLQFSLISSATCTCT
jgi:hypothetical protein